MQGLPPFFLSALCAFLIMLSAPAFAAPSVKAVGIHTFATGTHVVLELDQPLTPRVFTVANPDRLVIDMPEVIWGVPQTSGPVDSVMVRSFGYAPHLPGGSRLVLDLNEPVRLLGYNLRPAPDGRGHLLDIALTALSYNGPPPVAGMPGGAPALPPARAGAGQTPPAPLAPPASEALQIAEIAQDPAEAEEAAQRFVDEEMRRIAEERQRRVMQERAQIAAIQAAEEARMARLRPPGPSLLSPTIAPVAPPPPPQIQVQAPQPQPAPPPPEPLRTAAPPAPPAGPLTTPRRSESAVRKAAAETPGPRRKPQASELAGRGGYTPIISDVTGLNSFFSRPGEQVAMATPAARPEPAPPPTPAPPPPTPKLLVMLDPGHGGKDPGAVRNGVREKDVVLDFAKLLRDKLVASGRYEVQMTRNSDRFVELADRVEAARVMNADILISIHADALESPDVSGATAYLISEQGSNETLEEIIQNKDSGSVGGVILAREDIDIARVLIDLARRTTRNLSKDFADEIMKEFALIAPVVNRSVRPANYVVLRAPDTPTVLVELGFMSNDADLKRLQSVEWRGKAADAVVKALDAWRKKR